MQPKNCKFKKTSQKRIFFVTQYFPPDYASTGQLIKELISKLNYKKTVVYTGMPSYAHNENSIKNSFKKIIKAKIYRTKLTNFWPKKFYGRIINSFLFTINSFIKLIFSIKKNDVVILTSEPPFLYCISSLLKIFKKPKFIFIIFDIYPELLTKISFLNNGGLIVKFWNFLNKLSFDSSAEIIVLNGEMKKKILSIYKIDPKKISIISTWVDEKKLKNISLKKNWFIRKYQLKDKFVIMYSGNQGRGHDFKTIIETAYLLKKFKEFVFIFVGNGQQNKYLINEVKRLNLENCIFFPFQNPENLPYSLSAADVSVVTLKKDLDGVIAPSKLYGYLSTSIPVAVISSKKSYLKKIIEENNCGKWFLNNDSKNFARWLITSKNNKKSLKMMGQKGRKFILKNATLEICSKKYREIIDKYYYL